MTLGRVRSAVSTMCRPAGVRQHEPRPSRGAEVLRRAGTSPPAQRVGDLLVHRHRGLDEVGPDARGRDTGRCSPSTGDSCAPRCRHAAASSCSPRATPSSSRSPTPPPRSTPASPPSAPSPPTTGPTPTPPPASGWACTPATPSRSPASTPARRCTGPPGSPPPPTAARCSARPRRRTTPPRCPPRRTCSTSACTGCAASTTGSACSSSSRPAWSASSPARARSTQRAAQPAHPGHLVRRAAAGADRAGTPARPTTGWSRSSVRAARARPGSPSRWPGTLVESYPDGVWFVDVATVTDPGLVAFAVAAVFGLRPEPGRPMTDTLVDYASGRRMLLMLDTCDAQPGASAELIARLLTGGTAAAGAGHQPGAVRPARRGGVADPAAVAGAGPGRRSERRGGAAARPHGGRPRWTPRRPGRVGRPGTRRRPPRRAAAGDRAGRRPAAGALARASSPSASTTCSARSTPATTSRPAPTSRSAAARRARRTPSTSPRRRPAGSAARSCAPPSARRPSGTPPCRRPSPGRTGRWAPGRPGCCAGCRSSPARSTSATVEWLLDDDPLDPLAVLVDKSMIQVEPHGAGSTYRMLDPIRAYAARRLVDAGEEQTARDRHVAWCAARPAAGVPRCRRPAGHAVAVRARPARRRGARGAALDGDRGQRPDGAAARRRARPVVARARPGPGGPALAVPALRADRRDGRVDPRRGARGGLPHARPARRRRRRVRRGAAVLAAGRGGRPAGRRRRAAGPDPLRPRGAADRHRPAGRGRADQPRGHRVGEQRRRGQRRAASPCSACAELLWQRARWTRPPSCSARPGPWRRRGRPSAAAVRSTMLLGMVALARGDLVAAHDHLVVALRSRMAYGFHGRACDSAQRDGRAVRARAATRRRRPGSSAPPRRPGSAQRGTRRPLRRLLGRGAGGGAGGAGRRPASTPRTPRAPR